MTNHKWTKPKNEDQLYAELLIFSILVIILAFFGLRKLTLYLLNYDDNITIELENEYANVEWLEVPQVVQWKITAKRDRNRKNNIVKEED